MLSTEPASNVQTLESTQGRVDWQSPKEHGTIAQGGDANLGSRKRKLAEMAADSRVERLGDVSRINQKTGSSRLSIPRFARLLPPATPGPSLSKRRHRSPQNSGCSLDCRQLPCGNKSGAAFAHRPTVPGGSMSRRVREAAARCTRMGWRVPPRQAPSGPSAVQASQAAFGVPQCPAFHNQPQRPALGHDRPLTFSCRRAA